jgi:hypothetical protein
MTYGSTSRCNCRRRPPKAAPAGAVVCQTRPTEAAALKCATRPTCLPVGKTSLTVKVRFFETFSIFLK